MIMNTSQVLHSLLEGSRTLNWIVYIIALCILNFNQLTLLWPYIGKMGWDDKLLMYT